MRVMMVCPQISSSSFITTYPYANILSKEHDVKLIGPLLGKPPFIKDEKLKFEFIEPPFGKPPQLALTSGYFPIRKRLMQGDYDVIHAFKLFPNTALPAAYAKRKLGKKLVITVDDYDAISPKSWVKRAVLKHAERAYKSADRMIVSSTYLRKIYGGEVIYQVANEPIFLNSKSTGASIREKYGLQDKKIVMYAGTIFEHKGVDVLIKAVQALNRKDVKLVLIGEGKTELVQKLAGDETLFLGKIPMEQIPEFVAACDAYAIPTRDTGEYSRAQIPGKIFEPMMMAKPVLATRMSDIPTILDEGRAGVLAEQGSVESLASGLGQIFDDPAGAKKLGANAKARYLEEYSYGQIEKKVKRIYATL